MVFGFFSSNLRAKKLFIFFQPKVILHRRVQQIFVYPEVTRTAFITFYVHSFVLLAIGAMRVTHQIAASPRSHIIFSTDKDALLLARRFSCSPYRLSSAAALPYLLIRDRILRIKTASDTSCHAQRLLSQGDHHSLSF